MQSDDGRLAMISEQEFRKVLGMNPATSRVVATGDRFSIRGCLFEITGITDEGLTAKGIPPVLTGGILRNAKCTCGSGRKFKKCCGRME